MDSDPSRRVGETGVGGQPVGRRGDIGRLALAFGQAQPGAQALDGRGDGDLTLAEPRKNQVRHCMRERGDGAARAAVGHTRSTRGRIKDCARYRTAWTFPGW